jgi:GntR family transcriptional regulator, arabinose operon transcriptional repressor
MNGPLKPRPAPSVNLYDFNETCNSIIDNTFKYLLKSFLTKSYAGQAGARHGRPAIAIRTPSEKVVPRVMSGSLLDFAQRLHNDIARRRLVPGSRYLTAEEGARLLGTSVATANRALKMLADQDIVVRRRNSGTFVGPAVLGTATGNVRTISVLAPPSARRRGGDLRFDLIIQGVVAAQPDVADVRVSYVPASESVEFVRGLLESIRDSGQLAGVVAISCPREVYRYLGENQYPLVVMGSLYPDQPYPSIDTDEHQGGRLLVEYLVGRGHRRLALFSDSEDCPGDNYFHDGVSEALTAARLPHNALVLRVPGPDPEVLRAQLRELLGVSGQTTGIIVKLPQWADEAAEMAAERGLRVPEDVEIVFKDYAVGDPGTSAFPHARPSASNCEITARVGQMLARVRQGIPLEQSTVVVPYEMWLPPESE